MGSTRSLEQDSDSYNDHRVRNPVAKQPGYEGQGLDLQSRFARVCRVPGRMGPQFNSGNPPVELRHLLFASTVLVDLICSFAVQLLAGYLGFSASTSSDEESKEDDSESSANSAADNTRY